MALSEGQRPASKGTWVVYFLRRRSNTIYIGSSEDLEDGEFRPFAGRGSWGERPPRFPARATAPSLDNRWDHHFLSDVDGSCLPAPTMKQTDLLQGTLDLLILRVLSRGEMHGWGIADRIGQLSKSVLSVGEGSLYPALYRLQDQGWIESEWGVSDNNRKAKYYRLTKAGRKQLEVEKEAWDRLTGAIGAIMRSA